MGSTYRTILGRNEFTNNIIPNTLPILLLLLRRNPRHNIFSRFLKLIERERELDGLEKGNAVADFAHGGLHTYELAGVFPVRKEMSANSQRPCA